MSSNSPSRIDAPPATTTHTPQQYDSIGARYKDMKDLPCAEPELLSAKAAIGDIEGQRVLDLACGTGYYTRHLRSWGATHVLGVDISSGMIDAAQQTAASDDGIQFQVGDCGVPRLFETTLSNGKKQAGNFDLVFSSFFLNYASNETEETEYFRTVYENLRPGGRMVAITPNLSIDFDGGPLDGRYGVTVEGIEKIENGWKARLTAFTKPEQVQFEMYHLNEGKLYERCATRAGLSGFNWKGLQVPEDNRKETGYWDVYMQRPHIGICEAWMEER